MSHNDLCLSVVATSRNDNHGKDLVYRMQCFVDGFVEQCKRHNLKAELILVEWNPPENTLPLAQALRFPADKGPCSIRIIRVPNEIHKTLDHADKIPLFQMIGKNIGIRRALGKFVLATNIDILFSDNLMRFIKRKLKTGKLYRVDRLDVPERLPPMESFDEVLEFCSKKFFRINHKLGTKSLRNEVQPKLFPRLARLMVRTLSTIIRKLLNTSIMSMVRFILSNANRTELYNKIKFYSTPIIRFIFPRNSLFPHTNACGDFTLLSFDDWSQLRGYPEWNIFSWHLDSVLIYQARQHGIKEVDLPRKMSIFHIEHETGSGYSPEGVHQLFNRLHTKGIPYLTNEALKNLDLEMKTSRENIIYNDEGWGMTAVSFEEFVV